MNKRNWILFFLGFFKCQICMDDFKLNSVNVISDSIAKFSLSPIDHPSYCITSFISKNKQQHSTMMAFSEREQGKKISADIR